MDISLNGEIDYYKYEGKTLYTFSIKIRSRDNSKFFISEESLWDGELGNYQYYKTKIGDMLTDEDLKILNLEEEMVSL